MLFNAAALAGLFVSLPLVRAGFDSGATNNLAIYWGQNSANQESTQSRLSTYCSNTPTNIIPLAFMNVIKNPPTVNFANAGNNCSLFPGTSLLSCPQIEADIKTCQGLGKTILLSLGGFTYTEGGFTSSSEAVQWANTVWAMFGPQQSGSSVNRPFGTAVVDGFDFDFESTTSNMAPFANQLRSVMDANGSKKFYLSAAPQCFYPDAADWDMLNGATYFDFIMIQFYNNGCGAQSFVTGSSSQSNFNYATWDNWAKTISKNRNVKILIGVPGSPTAAGSGYVSTSTLASIVSYAKGFSSFGGLMLWDMSQVYANSGFLSGVATALGASAGPGPSSTTMTTVTRTTTTTTTTATSTTTAPPSSGSGVPQWGQCGGQDYTGPTVCAAPYGCNCLSVWWCQCQ
ncbi:glycoside hydrolase [Thozetella sp. PMI_491]|nr:glycoside hydrolase [Thozetella sp. PMI_491]